MVATDRGLAEGECAADLVGSEAVCDELHSVIRYIAVKHNKSFKPV